MSEGVVFAALFSLIIIMAGMAGFAPDRTAQRIEACMTQPNMEYLHARGCVRIDE